MTGTGLLLRPGTQDTNTVHEVRAYRGLGIRADDVVLDLGGNIGAFAVEALAAGASVIGVEPEPANAQIYRVNAPAARLLVAAVGAQPGEADLWLGASNSHSLIARRGRTQSCRVPVVTLPALLAAYHPTIIKCDIEGSEYDLDWRDLSRVRALAIELHFTPKRAWHQQARQVVQTVDRQGFRQTRQFRDTGTNWHCVTIWHRDD